MNSWFKAHGEMHGAGIKCSPNHSLGESAEQLDARAGQIAFWAQWLVY